MRDSQFATNEELEAMAKELTGRAGLEWSALINHCSEVVVFGSHAAGFQTPLSDLDLLVVGQPVMVLTLPHMSRIDLVFRTEEQVHSADWLKSELAGHIAVYGRWLYGADDWRAKALEGLGENSAAAEAKRRRIGRLTHSLHTHWDRLTPDFRIRNLITLRREEQRLRLLESGVAVPPTRLLDIWAERDSLHLAHVDAMSGSGRCHSGTPAIARVDDRGVHI